MVRYHAVDNTDCQSLVRYLLEVSGPKFNQAIEPLHSIALLTDLEIQKILIRIQCLKQATPLDQHVFAVWVYSLNSKNESWSRKATQTTNNNKPLKHSHY